MGVEDVLVGSGISKSFPTSARQTLRAWLGTSDQTLGYLALDDIGLRIADGEIVGILGRNGAGKSTLLRVLGRIFDPDKGSIQGPDNIVTIAEMGGLANSQLTGREFAKRYIKLVHPGTDPTHLLVEDIKDFSELEDAFDEPTRTYSSGMLARLLFSVATSVQEPVYLLDEFLVAGDEYFVNKCWMRLRELLGGSTSGVLSTHDWPSLLRLCRTTVVMDAGRIIDAGLTSEVVGRYLAQEPPNHPCASLLVPKRIDLDNVRDLAFEFAVNVTESLNLEVAWSIELFSEDRGWESLIVENFHSLDTAPGHNQIDVTYEGTRLTSGAYTLNVFLRAMKDEGPPMGVDAVSWLYGNGSVLSVTGDSLPTPLTISNFQLCGRFLA